MILFIRGQVVYEIKFNKKSLKQLIDLDEKIKIKYIRFFKELKLQPFLGKLSETEYHAHIKYHWVAVWEIDKQTETVIITYIGSREDAPYGR
jgi:mRNA-degrading endonuclease RelE of RelBE toxin-antitoxin system